MNPRAAINDLHPFQGCPFSHLGYFSTPESLTRLLRAAHYRIFFTTRIVLCVCPVVSGTICSETERVGFEPTRPCGQTVFKTASL